MERGNVGRAHFPDRSTDARVVQVLEPEVHVLSNDGRSLERRSGQSYHHKTDFPPEQGAQKTKFTFAERRSGHESNSFSSARAVCVPAE